MTTRRSLLVVIAVGALTGFAIRLTHVSTVATYLVMFGIEMVLLPSLLVLQLRSGNPPHLPRRRSR